MKLFIHEIIGTEHVVELTAAEFDRSLRRRPRISEGNKGVIKVKKVKAALIPLGKKGNKFKDSKGNTWTVITNIIHRKRTLLIGFPHEVPMGEPYVTLRFSGDYRHVTLKNLARDYVLVKKAIS